MNGTAVGICRVIFRGLAMLAVVGVLASLPADASFAGVRHEGQSLLRGGAPASHGPGPIRQRRRGGVVEVGQLVRYTEPFGIGCTNCSLTETITIEISLPETVELVSAASPDGSCSGARFVTCSVTLSVGPNEQRSSRVAVVFRPLEVGDILISITFLNLAPVPVINEIETEVRPSKQSIAAKYAPIVFLHPDEKYWPMSAEDFIAQSSLVWEHADPDCPDVILVGRGSPQRAGIDPWRLGARESPEYQYLAKRGQAFWSQPGRAECRFVGLPYRASEYTRPHDVARDVANERNDESQLRDLAEGFALDLDDSARIGARSVSGALYEGTPVYYDYSGKEVVQTLTYWFFYGFSVPGKVGGQLFGHEGDWERVSVSLSSRTQKPTFVAYFQHDAPPLVVAWSTVPKKGTHPIVYSARQSHASYPVPGRDKVCYFARAQRICSLDVRSKGPAWLTWKSLRNLKYGVEWVDFGGAWGEVGAFSFTTGPLGPSRYKAARFGGLSR